MTAPAASPPASERIRWLALGAAALALAAAFGVRTGLSLLFHPWEGEFGWSRGDVSLIASLGLLVYGLGQATAGRAADRFGPRAVFLGSAALLGAAVLLLARVQTFWQACLVGGVLAMAAVGGASNVTGTVLVARWRIRRAALAIACVMVGGTAGQVVIVPLTAWLLGRWGWRGALTALGTGIVVVLLPVMWALLREPGQAGPAGGGGREPSQPLREVARHPSFWWLVLTFWICGFTTAGLVETHLIPYAEDIHIDAVTAAQAMSVLGIFNFLGVLAAGGVADRWGHARTLTMIYAGRAGSLVIVTFAQDPVTLFVFAALFGLLDFSTVPPTSTLAALLFGRGSAGTVFGLVTLSHQVGSAVGAWAGGFAHDVLGSYTMAFAVAAALALGASVMAWLIPEPRPREVRPPATPEPVG